MSKGKVIIVCVVAALLLVLILQNIEPATVTLFFLKMTMPMALLIAIVSLLAYGAGVITDGKVFRRPKGPPYEKVK